MRPGGRGQAVVRGEGDMIPHWLLEAEWLRRRWRRAWWHGHGRGRLGQRRDAWCFRCRRGRSWAVETWQILEEAVDYVYMHGISKVPQALVLGEACPICVGGRKTQELLCF